MANLWWTGRGRSTAMVSTGLSQSRPFTAGGFTSALVGRGGSRSGLFAWAGAWPLLFSCCAFSASNSSRPPHCWLTPYDPTGGTRWAKKSIPNPRPSHPKWLFAATTEARNSFRFYKWRLLPGSEAQSQPFRQLAGGGCRICWEIFGRLLKTPEKKSQFKGPGNRLDKKVREPVFRENIRIHQKNIRMHQHLEFLSNKKN